MESKYFHILLETIKSELARLSPDEYEFVYGHLVDRHTSLNYAMFFTPEYMDQVVKTIFNHETLRDFVLNLEFRLKLNSLLLGGREYDNSIVQWVLSCLPVDSSGNDILIPKVIKNAIPVRTKELQEILGKNLWLVLYMLTIMNIQYLDLLDEDNNNEHQQ
jgi:hypothetical protein